MVTICDSLPCTTDCVSKSMGTPWTPSLLTAMDALGTGVVVVVVESTRFGIFVEIGYWSF